MELERERELAVWSRAFLGRKRALSTGSGKKDQEARRTNKWTESARTMPGVSFFWQQRGAEPADLLLSLKTWRHEFIYTYTSSVYTSQVRFVNHHLPNQYHHSHQSSQSSQVCQKSTSLSLRALIAVIKYKLQTIHPNPGPRNEEGRRRRTERRKKKRVEKRLKKQEAKEKSILVVTWNVQRMSLGTRNKRKAKSVAELAKKENWDIVLLSEVRAERNGVVWIGEGEDLTAIVFCKRAGILIRGHMLRKWGEGGQSVEFKERAIQIRINEFVFVSTYQPVYRGGNDVELEQAKAEVKELAGKARREDVLVIGGDFNAHVGGGEDRRGVCGKFGLRESNEQGRVLLDWCQENDLTHINSFFNHKWQGTWFSIPLKRWYELDGFIMRDNQRHKYVKKSVVHGGHIALRP